MTRKNDQQRCPGNKSRGKNLEMSMDKIHGYYPWILSMDNIHGYYPWILSMDLIRSDLVTGPVSGLVFVISVSLTLLIDQKSVLYKLPPDSLFAPYVSWRPFFGL